MSGRNSSVIIRIREKILHGELRPGDRLKESDLARSLGVSRTPVREALPMLAEEGMLLKLDTRGFVVREFSAQEIMDAIDVRGVLEGVAARMLAEQGVPRRLMRSLEDCLREGDAIFAKGHILESEEGRYGDMNEQLHSLIIEGSGSRVISEALQRNGRVPFASAHAIAFDKMDLHRMYSFLWYAHHQHHAIVEALEHGEGARVARLMLEHACGVKSAISISIAQKAAQSEPLAGGGPAER